MSIRIKHSSFYALSQKERNGLLGLRYKVFKKRLGWKLKTQGVFEQDDYDTANAHYLFAEGDSQQVIGCWRLIPTHCRYMLKDTFAQLLGSEPAPCDPRIVELSRFAVQKQRSEYSVSVSEVTLKMLQAAYLYAAQHGIDEYVTVTSVQLERLMRRIGIPMERIGHKQETLIDETRSVALRIKIDRRLREVLLN